MAQGNSRIRGWRIYPVGRMEWCSVAPPLRDLSRVCCADGMRPLRKRCMDRRGILSLAHRGVIHVRGKDCVHLDIGVARPFGRLPADGITLLSDWGAHGICTASP